MRTQLLAWVRGQAVLSAIGFTGLLGLLLVLAPAFDRAALLVVSTGMLVGVGALGIWLLHDHKEIEWTTSAGRGPRVRGSDRRVTALARTIDASLGGDEAARSRVHSTLRSLAEARLALEGCTLAGSRTEAEAMLGPDLTAYLTSSKPRPVTADELASFITILEEH